MFRFPPPCKSSMFELPSGGHFHLSSARTALAGTRNANALAWNRGSLNCQKEKSLICYHLLLNLVPFNFMMEVGPNLPDSHRALDEGGDPHTGEDGANELADGILVLSYTQRFCQEEGNSYGATETCQIMLEGRLGGRVKRAIVRHVAQTKNHPKSLWHYSAQRIPAVKCCGLWAKGSGPSWALIEHYSCCWFWEFSLAVGPLMGPQPM